MEELLHSGAKVGARTHLKEDTSGTPGKESRGGLCMAFFPLEQIGI